MTKIVTLTKKPSVWEEVSDMLGGEVTVYGLSNAMIGLR